MKSLQIFLVSLYSIFINAQVGIGTTYPNGALDINSTNQGLIIPRVSLTDVTLATPVINPTGGSLLTSTLVFNSNTTSLGVNSVYPGYYYWGGSRWIRLNTDLSWLISGNANTNSSINFLGTIDNVDLVFKRNNILSGKLSETNTSFGVGSLKLNTTGNNNTAFGVSSLENNISGVQNTAIGKSSLMLNTSGSYNIAIGNSALERNTIGILNTAIGNSSLFNNLNGRGNVAVGKSAIERNISGSDNTAVGYNSMYNNQTGNSNVAIGTSSMERNVSGSRNIAIGNSSLYNNQSTSNCLAIGHDTQTSNMSGQNNISLGNNSLVVNQTGNDNIAIGNNAYYNGSYNNSIALGSNVSISADNQVRIGNSSVTSIGGFANWTNVSDKRFKNKINYDNVPGLDFIMRLKPVTYVLDQELISNFIGVKTIFNHNESELQTGFIAQEVETAANAINFNFSGVDKPKNENDYYGLKYAEFVVPLTKAVQEQQKVIEYQQKEIDELKIKLNQILKEK